ncbi:MAG: type 3 dihydrofolate reductase [Pantoea sp. Brub]|nr:type 3 dihydrofolate reductase [Pantoea sp. Brub]
MISLIAALGINRCIGINNSIPWYLPADLAWFKKNTVNKIIIMGRITFESIGCVPLPKRLNIVISNNIFNYSNIFNNNIIWVKSLNEAIKLANMLSNNKEIMIIGGASIYSQTLRHADRLYLTHIDCYIASDIKFPFYNFNKWKCIFKEYHNADNKNIYNYYFEILDKY